MPSATLIAVPSTCFTGTVQVPGDKSISHRSIMFGALASGQTTVSGFLQGEDSLHTLQAFQSMGVKITELDNGDLAIQGVGLHGLQAPVKPIYLGNSGTSIRLLAGLLAGQSFDSVLSGDDSLSKRPMARITEPLTQMGAVITTADNGRPPLAIQGQQILSGMVYTLPMASAQVKSCILLAGLYANGETTVIEPAPTRDHTERMLRGFGCQVDTDGNRITVQSGQTLQASNIIVPGDISSAAFFMVAASIARDADIVLSNIGLNPTRTGVIDILRLMGADIEILKDHVVGGEIVADIRVRSADLKGISIPDELVPLAIDEFPALFIAAACAEGQTILTGAEELRVKESDRIQVMADGLKTLGASAMATADGISIDGCPDDQVFSGGIVNSMNDHRIAMSFSLTALRSKADIQIQRAETINTSFPSYVDLVSTCGLQLVEL